MDPSVKAVVIVLWLLLLLIYLLLWDELYSIMVIKVFVQLLVATICTAPTVPLIFNNDMIMIMIMIMDMDMDMNIDHSKAAAATTIT